MHVPVDMHVPVYIHVCAGAHTDACACADEHVEIHSNLDWAHLGGSSGDILLMLFQTQKADLDNKSSDNGVFIDLSLSPQIIIKNNSRQKENQVDLHEKYY